MAIQKGVRPVAFRTAFDGITTLLIINTETQIEAPQQFHEPLVDQRFGQQNQHPVGPAGEVQPEQDQTGLDRFPEADLIGQQHPGLQPP